MGQSAEKQTRDRLCQFKVGDRELGLIKHRAEGFGDLSKWIRSRVFEAEERLSFEYSEATSDLLSGLRERKQTLKRLHEHNRRLGIRLDQGLHRIHLRIVHTTGELDGLAAMLVADRDMAEQADEIRRWMEQSLPKKPRRRRLCRFRVTEDELRDLKIRASGSPGLSAWIRERLGLCESLPRPEHRRRLDGEIVRLHSALTLGMREHRRWAANLQQVRRRVEDGVVCSSPTFEETSARLRGAIVETLDRLSQARRSVRARTHAW